MVEKLAARAGIRQLRQLFRSGNIQEAEQLASHAPQILAGRNLPRGSQIRQLGAGTEGVAQHVLMPQGHSAVVKTYDRTSPIYSPAVQQTRASLAGKQIPGHAQTYSFHQTPNAEYAINEYIPAAKQRPNAQQIAATQAQARHAVPGHELLDIGAQNHVLDARTGKSTIIDSIPVPQQDTMPQALRKGMPENVLNYHLNPASPTGQTVNAFKEEMPTWRRDAIHSQVSSDPYARTLAGNEQVARHATQQHSNELLQQAYRQRPQVPATQAPQALQAPQVPQATQAPQATRAMRPQPPQAQAQAQATQAARPARLMSPRDMPTRA